MIASSKNCFRSRAQAQAATVATALALISTTQAQTIVWSGLLNHSVRTDVPDVGDVVPLDFNLNSSADNFEAYLWGGIFGAYDACTLVVYGNTAVFEHASVSFVYQDEPVALNSLIDSSLPGYNGRNAHMYSSVDGGHLAPGDTGYFAFTIRNEGNNYHGWMEISLGLDGGSGTLREWAYNSLPGESILAGQTSAVPEPATHGMMCGLALAGWAVVRRRRGKASVV